MGSPRIGRLEILPQTPIEGHRGVQPESAPFARKPNDAHARAQLGAEEAQWHLAGPQPVRDEFSQRPPPHLRSGARMPPGRRSTARFAIMNCSFPYAPYQSLCENHPNEGASANRYGKRYG